MRPEHRKIWVVMPKELPAVLRRCPKCGRSTEFKNSGRFRVNANGRLLDVWLIFRCGVCDTSWNMAIYQRVGPETLDPMEYKGFLENRLELAVKYGCSRELFAKNKAEQAMKSKQYTIRVSDTPMLCRTDKWGEVQIRLGGGIEPRMDALLAEQLSISRSKVKQLCEEGLIRVDGEKAKAGARVKDGIIIYISRERWTQGEKEGPMAAGGEGCVFY